MAFTAQQKEIIGRSLGWYKFRSRATHVTPAAPVKKATPTKRQTRKAKKDGAWAWGVPVKTLRRNPLLRGRTRLRETLG